MNRKEIVLRGITKSMLGVEIGPFHSPLAPKKENYRSLSLDIHPREQLVSNAHESRDISPETIERIEEVDLVGSGTDLARLIEEKGLLGQIDYVISSHNFEHLPNPIEFLKACALVLKPDGIISMLVPDRRGCFDYFRPLATTADFLGAFLDKRVKPTVTQVLLHRCLQARRQVDNKETSSWDFKATGDGIYPIADFDDIRTWIKELPAESERPYTDTHCSSFTRSSFELIIRDLHYMGYIDVGLEHTEGPAGNEFFARLRKGIPIPNNEEFCSRRTALLHEIIDDTAINSHRVAALQQDVEGQKAQLTELQQKVEKQNARIHEILESKSWRYTAPFRRLGAKFSKPVK